MLLYELMRNENGALFFYFFPEGNRNAPGIVVFYSDGAVDVVQDSTEDFKRWYAGHAISGINREKESGMVAWF